MKKIKTFYTPKQVCTQISSSFSKSPLKPKLLMEKIQNEGYGEYFDIVDDFKPIEKSDFLIAHTEEYVNNFYNKTGNYMSNALPWSQELVDSLPYTTGSLLAAKRFAIQNPGQIAFAPVSGMHHAQPHGGCGYCTFSGQVISAIKIYEEFGLSGAYLDLDEHFGNSIADSYSFNPTLIKAIPEGCNVNPEGYNEAYLLDFEKKLKHVENLILDNKVHYVVFAHGADSHEDDDLGGSVDTNYWLSAAETFSMWVKDVSKKLGKPLPVVLCLFGGYRHDNYEFVLDLHLNSLLTCSSIIYKQDINIKELV